MRILSLGAVVIGFADLVGMGRAKAILQSDYPYNISARCINRDWFNLPMEKVWNIFCEELSDTVEKHNLKIHSFVLMTNHFHLIASTPDANISQCMHHFVGRSSRRLTRQGNRINETFAGRHYKCILHHHNYYLNAYKYNYRNPISAGICKRVQDYPFSTLPSVTGLSSLLIPLVHDLTYHSDPEGTLRWLNQTPDPIKLEAARFGFKRQYFQSKKCRILNKPILSEKDTL